MILDRALKLVLHSACILGAFGGRGVRLPPVRKRVAWSRSVDSAASPLSCCWLTINRVQKWETSPDNEKLSLPGRSSDLRSDDALFRTDERANYRFPNGHLREGCDD
jgi:hypothetical protein